MWTFRDQAQTHPPQLVRLLWASDQPDADTFTWQHTTLTVDKLLCARRNSKFQYQQVSGRRVTTWTERPLGSALCLTAYKFDAVFIINGFFWGGGAGFPKSFPSFIDIIDLRVPTWNLRDVPLFHECPFFKIVPPLGVPLQHMQFVVLLMSSEGKLSHQGLV